MRGRRESREARGRRPCADRTSKKAAAQAARPESTREWTGRARVPGRVGRSETFSLRLRPPDRGYWSGEKDEKMNRLKTLILLASLTALLLFLGQIVGGERGIVIALVLAGVMNLGSYWFSDKIVLATYRAREVSPAQAPEFYDAIQELST